MFDHLLDDYENEKKATNDVVVGIDLGTTNSVVAFFGPKGPEVIADAQGQRIHPSAISWLPTGERITGVRAKHRRVVDPLHTVMSAKRLIGQRFSQEKTKEIARSLSYGIKEGVNDEILIETRAGDIPVAQVSSYVLEYLKAIAEKKLGKTVTHCVVTVPAHFSDSQRSATRNAAELAGMQVLRVLNEPTSAAVAYGHSRNLNKRIAIFDFGGGTFDVTVLAVRENLLEVIATGGDPFLGGDDIDQLLLNRLADSFLAQHRIDPRNDPMSNARLQAAAEQIKVKLTTESSLSANLSEIGHGSGGESLGLKFEISRDEFNLMISQLVDRAMDVTTQVLSEARIAPPTIDEVILVGGSSRIPIVRTKVEELFKSSPKMNKNPMEVVALGAALQGHHLLHPSDDATVLMDVAPHSLRVATVGGFTKVLINKNDTVPCEGIATFNPGRQDQNKIIVRVCQGEEKSFEDNIELGSLELDALTNVDDQKIAVDISFTIDSDGILQINAKEQSTGKAAKATLTLVGHNETR